MPAAGKRMSRGREDRVRRGMWLRAHRVSTGSVAVRRMMVVLLLLPGMPAMAVRVHERMDGVTGRHDSRRACGTGIARGGTRCREGRRTARRDCGEACARGGERGKGAALTVLGVLREEAGRDKLLLLLRVRELLLAADMVLVLVHVLLRAERLLTERRGGIVMVEAADAREAGAAVRSCGVAARVSACDARHVAPRIRGGVDVSENGVLLQQQARRDGGKNDTKYNSGVVRGMTVVQAGRDVSSSMSGSVRQQARRVQQKARAGGDTRRGWRARKANSGADKKLPLRMVGAEQKDGARSP